MASTIVNFESHTATMQQNIDGILASVDNLTRVKELVDTYRLVRKVMIFLIIVFQVVVAVRDAIRGDITPRVQASILQSHRDVYWMLDKAAASLL